MNIVKNLISNKNNYSVGRDGLDMQLFFVLHTYNGKGKSLYNYFNSENGQVSAHFAVFLDGGVEQYVQISDTAYHAGRNWVNVRSIGIEHQDNGNPADSIRSNELYESSAQLIAQMALKIGYTVLGEYNIKTHKEMLEGGTGCPGGLDVDKIRKRANEILQELLQPSTPLPDPKDKEIKNLKEEIKKIEEKNKKLEDEVESQKKELENKSILIENLSELLSTAESMGLALQTKLETLENEKKDIVKSFKNFIKNILNFILGKK